MRLILSIAAGLLLVSPAWADFEGNQQDCGNAKGWTQANACSRLLESNRFDTSNRAIIHNNRGAAFYFLKQYDRAIRDYDEALRLHPQYAYAYNNRGLAYRDLTQYHRAVQDYSEAIKLNPGFVDAYGNRGWAYEVLRQKRLALNDYLAALRLRPGDKVATAGLKRLGVTP